MKIQKAIRKAIPFIGCLYGKSGSGKTYSSIKLAQGLADGGKICLIDTENERASHYADEFDFDVLNLTAPFTPNRYVEAIKYAENKGYKVLVIDSISHEWDGSGGCIEMVDNNNQNGLNAWNKPKTMHKKLIQCLLMSRMHIIICARAKDNVKQVGRDIINDGITLIQEKNFLFEMLINIEMKDNGIFEIKKCPDKLMEIIKNELPNTNKITKDYGTVILNWIIGGEKVNFNLNELRTQGTEIVINNGIPGLTKWFLSLSKNIQDLLKKEGIMTDLKNIASEYHNEDNKTNNISTAPITIDETKEQQNL